MSRLNYLSQVVRSSAALLLLLCMCAAVMADETPEQRYKSMVAKIESLKTFQVTIDETMVLQPSAPGAKPRTIPSTSQVVYKSPNLLSLKNDGLMGGGSIVSNGKQEVVYSDFTQEYAVVPAPADIVSHAFGGFSGKSVTWTSSEKANVNGKHAEELQGTMNTSRGVTLVTLYLKQDDSLPIEAVIVLPSVTSPTGNGLKITRTEMFSDEKINEPVSTALFKFSPPDGATKVGSISELTSGMGGGGGL